MIKKTKRRGRGEGALFYSDALGKYVGRVKVSGRVVQRSAPTKAVLLEKLRAASPAAAAATMTVGEYLASWLAGNRTIADSAKQMYSRVVRAQLAPRLGNLRLARVTRDDVRLALTGMLADGLSVRYVRTASGALSAALRDAEEGKLIKEHPARRVRLPKVPRADIDVLDLAECATAIDASQGRKLGAFAILLLTSGMRMQEALALDWRDFDAQRRTVSVTKALFMRTGGAWERKTTKSRQGTRVIDVPEVCAAALARHRADFQPDEGKPIFAVFKGRLPSPDTVRRCWADILKAAGVRVRPPHHARHSHASALLEEGVGLVSVAARLGDHPATVAATYSHFVGKAGRLASVVEGLYGGRQSDGKVAR